MRCRDFREETSRRLFGDLDPERAKALEAHLAACEACRAREAEVSGALGALRRLEAFERQNPVPPANVAAILSRDPAPRWIAWRRIGRAAAAVLALVGAASLFRAQVEARDGSITLALSLPWGGTRALPTGSATVDPSIVPLVRETVADVLEPSLRGVARSIAALEARRAMDVETLTLWLEGRRRADARVLTGVLAETRRDLDRTQEAVLEVAGLIPSERPGW